MKFVVKIACGNVLWGTFNTMAEARQWGRGNVAGRFQVLPVLAP